MTIGEHLLNVADAGLALTEITIDSEMDTFLFLDVLLDIEDTLDLGRICIGASGSGNEHITEINTRMDELRRRIVSRIETCDKIEFEKFMEIRTRRLQNQFSKHP